MKKVFILLFLFTTTLCFGQFKVVSKTYITNEKTLVLILERNDSLFQVVGNKAEKYKKNMIYLRQGDLINIDLKTIYPYPDPMFNAIGFMGNTVILWNNIKITISDLFHRSLYIAEEVKGELIQKKSNLTFLTKEILSEKEEGKTVSEIAQSLKIEIDVVEEILNLKQ